MVFFEKKVDLRSRAEMMAFLAEHFRYNTMNAVNLSTSYAQCVKLHRLGLSSDQLDAAYEMLSAEYWEEISDPIDEFVTRHDGNWSININGRSGGYLVLYRACGEPTGHRSHCLNCGQRNFKSVVELPADPRAKVIAEMVIGNRGMWRDEIYLEQSRIRALKMPRDEALALVADFKRLARDATVDNRCGRCGVEGESGRVNYARSPMRLSIYAGKSIDAERDFEEWSMEDLRTRVRLVQDFDRTCDQLRENFIGLLEHCEVIEEVIEVPHTVKRIVCAGHVN